MKSNNNIRRSTLCSALADSPPTPLLTGRFGARLGLLWRMAALILLMVGASVQAQDPWVRFTTAQIRVTVPLNTTNSVVITNLVEVSTNIASAVNFNVSGLPAGASATLTDTNGNALLSTMIDTNLWLTLSTTNIAEGLYTFYLNASGGATNRLPFVLQAAHVWNGAGGAMGVTNLPWSASSNWFGGVPVVGSDVVFGDIGAQTNGQESSLSFTNSIVDASREIGSLRFSQTGLTNAIASDTNTPPRYHTIQINPAVTLTVSGTNGFSLLRDYIDERYALGLMGVNFVGGAGSKLVVSNETANFGILLDNNTLSTLNMTNLPTFVANVNRMGIGEYQIYPNYRALNDGFNGGRDTNEYTGVPRRFAANLLLARTNIIKAAYKNPDNYTNENTRAYAISQFNGEQYGNGSSQNTFFYLGASNAFLADSICFVGANHATGNGGACRFGTNDGVALFRGTNGTGRMSLFAVADDGGTNHATSNVKATIDFASLNGFVDVLATNLYVARDRTLVRSNDNPTTEATLIMGRGTIDVNTAILGFQEHSNKVDWTSAPYNAQVYRGYCRGELIVTNGGTFKVNGNLTLGYTADTNPEGSAQQYNTRGQITVYSNSFVIASNIVVDGGLNFTSTTARENNITLNQGGTLNITNTIGAAPGLPLDNLNIAQGGKLGVIIAAGKTNVSVNKLVSSGSTPGIIKVLSLPTFPSYPTNIPVIAYQTATPFLAAEMPTGSTVQGYILNNTANSTIDLFLTTNAPQALTWKGNVSANWDLSTKNWVTTVGAIQTNFTLGDIVTFDDTANPSALNVSIVEAVVPNQATNGVVINNTSKDYTFTAAGGGIVAAKVVKQGTGKVTFNASETGPFSITEGTVEVSSSGVLGATTVYSNAVLNCAGGIVGGLTSTGTVTLASSANVSGGPLTIGGGVFVNSGFVSCVNPNNSFLISGGALVTNNVGAEIDVDTGANGNNYRISGGAIVANFGTIKHIRGRMNLGLAANPADPATLFGTGRIEDSDGGLTTGNDGRLAINQGAVVSPGTNFAGGDIATMYVGARVDLNNVPAGGLGVLRIDVDFANPQTNDIIQADKWNNMTGMILMTNVNPGAGSFALGQVFQIFQNNNPGFPNNYDVSNAYPAISPVVPAPGLTWGLADFRPWGAITVTNPGLVWNGNVSASWATNDNANWQGGKVYTDGLGVLLDDSASGTTSLILTSSVAPVGFPIGTNVAMTPGMVVSNGPSKEYIIAGTGKISGMTSLYKIGSGTLTILTTNDYWGNSILAGGTVVATNVASLGVAGASGMNSETFIDGATLKYVGQSATWPRSFVINENGATVEVTAITNTVLTAATIYGPGALTKTGPGTLVLAQSADNYLGGTYINAGAVRLTGATAGPGGITLANSATQELSGNFTFTNAMNVTGPATTLRVLANSTNVSGGAWTGNGNVAISSTGAVQLVFNADISGFSGTLSEGTSTNSLRFNNATNKNDCLGSAAATFDLGTGASTLNNFNGGGVTYDLGALAGGPKTVLYGRSSTNLVPWPAGTTYRIGANGSSTAFDGKINNGLDTVSVVKVGNGTLALNGANGFTGSLTVSNGTLGGNGSLTGDLIVRAGATLAPGTSVGTFTVGGTAALNGAVVLELNRLNNPLPNDRLSVTGAITASGTLLVTNVGPDLYNGSTYVLFNKAVSGFSSVTLPPKNPSGTVTYAWLNNLAANGSITLQSGGSTNPVPPKFTASYSGGVGGTLTMSWPYDYLGWTMRSNSVGLLETNMWFPIAGSGATNQVITTIDSNEPNVFFRLQLP